MRLRHFDARGSYFQFTSGGTGAGAWWSVPDSGLTFSGNYTEYGYAGGRYDQASGLYYLGHRYYAPYLGRFLSPDPSGLAAGINLYAYAGNDPINNVDPSGLSSQDTNQNSAGINGFDPSGVRLVGGNQEEAVPGAALRGVRGLQGSTDPGGQWATAAESMSARSAAYQAQITGRTAGQAYFLNGVRFDGFNGTSLLEAKGLGYAQWVSNGQFKPFFQGADKLVVQAQRQIAASSGFPIEWHIAEPEVIPAMRNLFQSNGISGINLVHTPVAP